MIRYTDLQTQTYFSDGTLSPTALVRLAKRYKISQLAITDHCTTDGIPEARKAGKRYGVTILPGVELYARHQGKELHILGYDFRERDPAFQAFLRTLQRDHLQWLARVCELLIKDGWQISFDDFAKSPSRFLGFFELLSTLQKFPKNRARLRADFGTATPDLFNVINRYFVLAGPAAVPLPEKKLPAATAIRMIRAAGGYPVLAHPGQHLNFSDDHLVHSLVALGLEGIETMTPHHTWHQMLHYQRLAKTLGLFSTAGSDFHEYLDASYHSRCRWDVFLVQQPLRPWKHR